MAGSESCRSASNAPAWPFDREVATWLRAAARTRSTGTAVPAVVAGDAKPAPVVLPSPAESPRAPEDGTKTAISAAVPAAERVSAVRGWRFGKRSLGIAALASISAVALAAMSVAMNTPEATVAEPVSPRASVAGRSLDRLRVGAGPGSPR